ncbi:MAG: hypothetical protein ACYTDT_10000 [Planctomycetota bacterium]|jgi:hypothetical protein
MSWSGLGREPYTFSEGAVVPGAHLCLLRDSEYSGFFHRHILFTAAAAAKDAEQIAIALQDMPSPVPVDVRVIDLNDPTDHVQIAYGLAQELAVLDDEQKLLDHELYVLLNAGTPQMQTVWVLLRTLELLQYKIIQTSPLKIANMAGRPVAFESDIDAASMRRMFFRLSERTGR